MNIQREVISGVSGGLVFLAVFWLGGHFFIALACGIAVFVTAWFLFRKKTPEVLVTMDGVDSSRIEALTAKAKVYFERMDSYIRSVQDPVVKTALTEIFRLNLQMMIEAEKSGMDTKIAKDLVEFYLPSICKVMDQYLTVTKNNIRTESVLRFQEDVQRFLKQMHESFVKQLEAMLSDNMFDAKVEMDMVKSVLKGDGFWDNDFKDASDK